MPSPLVTAAAAAHDRLIDRKREATVISFPPRIREGHSRIYALLSSTTRHVAALEAVLVDAVRSHLGPVRARELRRVCHELQLDLHTTQARLHGSAQTMHLPWRILWDGLDRSLHAALDLEQEIAADLSAVLPEDVVRTIAEGLAAAELQAPTRPHPYLPRRGWSGRAARWITHAADAFGDGVQGRPTTDSCAGGTR